MKRAVFILLILSTKCFAQTGKIDSLLQITRQGKGIAQADALNALALEFRNTDPDTSFYFADQAFKLSKYLHYDLGVAESNLTNGMAQLKEGKVTDAKKTIVSAIKEFQKINIEERAEGKRVKKNLANAYNTLGNIYYSKGEYLLALSWYQNSLKIREAIQDQEGIAISYNNMALIFSIQGNHSESLKNYFASVKIKEQLKNKKGLMTSYNNIGLIYSDQGKEQQAMEYLAKALKLAQEEGITNTIATCYINMGAVIMGKKDELALNYLNKALDISKETNNLENISNALGNIGEVYSKQGKYEDALSKVLEALKIKQETGDQLGEASFLVNISSIYLKIGDLSNATLYGEKSLALAQKIEAAKHIRDASRILAACYQEQGNFKKALEMQSLNTTISDSIYSKANSEELVKQELKYSYDKKSLSDSLNYATQKKITEISNQEERKVEENKRLTLYVILGLVVVFALFIFNRFRLIKKQKGIIEIQTKRLESAHVQLEEKHKEITDSINYAERIQRSMLASKKTLDEQLMGQDSYFVFFKPKDIVSGDFYWASDLVDGNFAVATADSTGHGVPGAIMSMLNMNSLKEAVKVDLTQPADILNYSRTVIINTLANDGSEEGGKDGMDCSLIVYNMKERKLSFSSAHNPVWIMRNKEVLEFKSDKMPVGKHDRQDVPFTQHNVDLQTGDIVYTLTDGFPDQFGGNKGKKYMSKNLKELLIANIHLSMKEQKNLLESTFDGWLGNYEQIDDVTIMGVRIP